MQSLKNKNSLILYLLLVLGVLLARPLNVQARTYTLDADFDEGTLINVLHDPSDQLQLDDTTEAFNFIWVAVSTKGTVVKINTLSGAVLGEYKTAPDTDGTNPSRTTVDKDGSVWVANRSGSSVVHIGLKENGQWIDRNSNGICDTSTGLGDVKAWSSGGVSNADDECIIHYVTGVSSGTRHVSVDANNDVWVSGTGQRKFDLISGGLGGGTIIRSEPAASPVLYGGYGGLIDPSGVIWSARRLLRWDTALPLTAGNWTGYSHDSYGLGIDSSGNVWNTALSGNIIRKFAPDGTLIGTYGHGDNNAQGCVADLNDDIWVAHTLYSGKNTVGHIKNDGTFVGNVTLDTSTSAQPTGVAVDAAGKIWATGYNSQKVYRIDPTAGPIGADGVTPIGAVDFTSVNLGGLLYNYSDMTGSTLIGAPDNGTWTVVYNSGVVDEKWGKVSWTADEPGDSSISVTAASSTDGTNFTPDVSVSHGVVFTVADGQYLRVSVSFARSTTTDADGDGTNDSPILYDLTIAALIEVSVDIKPTSCPNPLNVKSQGLLPVAICGTEDFDVVDIELVSLSLVGVAPLRVDLEDVATPFEPFLGKENCDECTEEGRDGFLDLTLKFDMQEIVAAIEADIGPVEDGDCLVLTLEGQLLDGTPIVGEDVVIIRKKGKKGKK